MSEVAHEAQPEFWQPPLPVVTEAVVIREVVPAMAEACPRCGTEFLLGSRFCHSCGGRRPQALDAAARADAAVIAGLWQQGVARVHSAVTRVSVKKVWSKLKFPAWLRYLHFHEIKRWVGLPTASLIAFVVGLACIAGALLVGLITARNLVDWQAIQLYRAEWLLAATAAFVAGILLKKPSDRDSE
jgi:hypothetical protein